MEASAGVTPKLVTWPNYPTGHRRVISPTPRGTSWHNGCEKPKLPNDMECRKPEFSLSPYVNPQKIRIDGIAIRLRMRNRKNK